VGSQPRFASKRLISWQHPYPELQAKAYNARVVTAWLARELAGLGANAPNDETICGIWPYYLGNASSFSDNLNLIYIS